MIAFSAQGITKEFGACTVLSGVTFQVTHGQKVGIVGANGSGKTTLLRMLLGLEPPTAGAVTRAEELRIGFVPQYLETVTHKCVHEYLLADYLHVNSVLRACEHDLATATSIDRTKARYLRAYQIARDAYDAIEGDHYQARAARMMSAFGLKGRETQPVSSLSGGEQNVLAMARALLNRPDILVLDEPANHLDYIGIDWLEKFLVAFKGTILVVSHNRYLLDRVVDTIFELAEGVIRSYRGNYSAYRATRLKERIAAEAQHEKYARELARLEAMVRRVADFAQSHSDKSWGRRLRSRRAQLDRFRKKAVEPPTPGPQRARVSFSTQTSEANIALRIRDYSKHFGKMTLFDRTNLDISCGERVALVGQNGCGKTTLLRDIVENATWQNPTLRIGPSIQIGYCAQQQELLEQTHTVFDEIVAAGAAGRQAACDILARFLFHGDDVQKRVGDLSGGERNRLQLARLITKRPNFLILDEPTNHLDIPMCEAIEEALDNYEGTLLIVSHDRYFLDKLVNRVVEVKNQKLESYPGTYSEFWFSRDAAPSVADGSIACRARMQKKKHPQAQRPAAGVKNRAKQRADIEDKITALESKKQMLECRGIKAAGPRQRSDTFTARELQNVRKQLDDLYEEWLALKQG